MAEHNSQTDNAECNPPPLRELRELISNNFATDSDLDAFLCDEFPHIHRQLSGGMDRNQKVTYLFSKEERIQIYTALVSYMKKAIAPSDDCTNSKSLPSVTKKSGIRCRIILNGKLDAINRDNFHAIVIALRSISDDIDLTIELVSSGSIVMIVRSTATGCARLIRHYRWRQALCGFRVLGIVLDKSVPLEARIYVYFLSSKNWFVVLFSLAALIAWGIRSCDGDPKQTTVSVPMQAPVFVPQPVRIPVPAIPRDGSLGRALDGVPSAGSSGRDGTVPPVLVPGVPGAPPPVLFTLPVTPSALVPAPAVR